MAWSEALRFCSYPFAKNSMTAKYICRLGGGLCVYGLRVSFSPSTRMAHVYSLLLFLQ